MNEYFLAIPGGLKIRFRTAADLAGDARARLYLGAHVPGVSILKKRPRTVDLSVDHVPADKTKLVSDGSSVTFFSKTPDIFSRDICHLLYGAGRKEQIKRGLYPVHAACVGLGERFMLLAGHSGAGKTTIAQHLVDQYGATLFSGNKTVIRFLPDGGIRALAGTRTMTAIGDDGKRREYELPPGDYTAAREVDISDIAMVRLNDAVSESAPLARSVAVRALYPFFMDAVNADVIVGDYHVYDGSVTAAAKRVANKGLRESFRSIPVSQHAGSLDFVTSRLLAGPASVPACG